MMTFCASTRVHGRILLIWAVLFACATSASAQSLSDVLSFILTNRSVATDDFVRDQQAAETTRDTLSRMLTAELGTLPISSSAGGFTYRLNSALDVTVRSSGSFGPFFSERALTAGEERASFGLSYQQAVFTQIDGRDLRDGTLVSTASRLRGDPAPFDVETVSLSLRTDTMLLLGNVGATDRLDLGMAVPIVRVSLRGERVDTYRGRALTQATASGSAVGLGDVLLRAKYNFFRRDASGLAAGAEASIPTGEKKNLLGTGRAIVTPRLIASLERDRFAVHGNAGVSLSSDAPGLDYRSAVTLVATPRLTLIGEMAGRQLTSTGRLTTTTTPNPRLVGVDTIRLTSTTDRTERLVAIGGLKWNVTGSWLLNVQVLRPLTDSGLNAAWVPAVTFDYSFER